MPFNKHGDSESLDINSTMSDSITNKISIIYLALIAISKGSPLYSTSIISLASPISLYIDSISIALEVREIFTPLKVVSEDSIDIRFKALNT